MSAFDMEGLDPEDDGEEVNMEEVAAAVSLTDDMLKINSSFFTKSQWNFLESDKSNTELFQKLAEFGAKNRDNLEVLLTPFSEEEYAGMRKHLMDKLGSPGNKCFPDLSEDGGEDKKSKDKGSKDKKDKDKKSSSGAKKGEVVKKADLIKRENMMKLIKDDVDKMSVNPDLSLPQIRNWHQPISLLVHIMHWAINVILSLRDKYKDSNGKLVSVSSKLAIDCSMSLFRAIKDLRAIAPPTLLTDAEFITEKLSKSLRSKCGEDLIGLISMSHPELIAETSYDGIKPLGISLYPEQTKVLRMIDSSVATGKPLLLGYKVPPSGGKTILSVAIASMLNQYHRDSKRLLYVCYNTLVRLAVANACYKADVPFWVASSWTKDGKLVSAIRPSNSCMDMKRDARIRRKRQTAAGEDKAGAMKDMWARAEARSDHHAPIIISDLASAVELLQCFPDSFVAYIDEPTAGAERGKTNNKVTEYVAKICSLLPACSVLLSATLPDIETELPSLANDFVARHESAEVVMIHSLRLPVGCDALSPAGVHTLPHQLAESWEEFVAIVHGIDGDALMQRFYTPGPVRQIANVVAKIAGSSFPKDLVFETVIPHIGAIKHDLIRRYAVDILKWVCTQKIETVFLELRAMEHSPKQPAVLATNLLTHHISDGKALALAVPEASMGESDVGEGLYSLFNSAMSPYTEKMPSFGKTVETYRKAYDSWLKQGEALDKSKVSKGDSAGAAKAELEAAKMAHSSQCPSFNWPVRVCNMSSTLKFEELESLPENIASQLLSGVAVYDPRIMTDHETAIVMKEASDGKLACLFASPHIVYGTNMDLITVFVGTSYSYTATRNALYQLIGRAGRTGKSYRAKVLFQDDKSMRTAMLPANENIEAQVIEHHMAQVMTAKIAASSDE